MSKINMNIFYVYILKCNYDSYYVGHTENLKLRLAEHNNGKYSGYTSPRIQLNWFIILCSI